MHLLHMLCHFNTLQIVSGVSLVGEYSCFIFFYFLVGFAIVLIGLKL